ncbi:hypothetical protein GCM10020001_028850 [Nonomuraea salmonea]
MTLQWVPATGRPDLLAGPVTRAVADLEGVEVAEIDPELADTAAFCERYGVSLDESANCVVVAAKRGGETRYAACMVLATMRVDVNGVVRRHLDARKTSFAPMADAVERTGMEYGGITPPRPARGVARPGRHQGRRASARGDRQRRAQVEARGPGRHPGRAEEGGGALPGRLTAESRPFRDRRWGNRRGLLGRCTSGNVASWFISWAGIKPVWCFMP